MSCCHHMSIDIKAETHGATTALPYSLMLQPGRTGGGACSGAAYGSLPLKVLTVKKNPEHLCDP